jgi:cyclophilin family peptidyl-prolyl cis-trans isomerase
VGGSALAVILVVGIALLVSSSPDSSNVSTGTTPTTGAGTTATTGAPATGAAFTYGSAPCAPAAPPTPPTLDFGGTNGFQSCLDPALGYVATFDTSAGTVKVLLDVKNTPGTTNNFVQLAGYGYYNGTKLFRTDTSIGIIQGGAPHTNSASDPGPGYTISDEGGKFTYQAGQLVMARTSEPNSGSAQFFFTSGDKSSALDAQGTYVVFGSVISGQDVLDQILASNVDQPGGLGGAPNPPVTINSVTIGSVSLVNQSPTG